MHRSPCYFTTALTEFTLFANCLLWNDFLLDLSFHKHHQSDGQTCLYDPGVIHLCLVLPRFSSKFNLPAFHLAQVQILFSKSSLPGLAFLPPFLNRNDPATNFKQGPYIIYIHYIFNLLKPWKFQVLQWDIYPVSTLFSIPNHGTHQKNTQSTDLVFKTCQILVCYKTSLYLLSKQQTRLVTGPRKLHRVSVALSDQINPVENMISDDHTKNHGL